MSSTKYTITNRSQHSCRDQRANPEIGKETLAHWTRSDNDFRNSGAGSIMSRQLGSWSEGVSNQFLLIAYEIKNVFWIPLRVPATRPDRRFSRKSRYISPTAIAAHFHRKTNVGALAQILLTPFDCEAIRAETPRFHQAFV